MGTILFMAASIMSSPHLATGIKSIDREHAQLLAHENLLAGICHSGHEECHTCSPPQREACSRQVSETYEQLIDMIIEHFHSEEKLMICLSHEQANAHKCEHAEISERLKSLVLASQGSAILTKPSALQMIVRHWLTEHIVRWDIPLAEALNPKRSSSLA